MATEAIYTKSLGGAEDLLLDASNSPTVIQTRAGKELEITKINSSTIPHSGKFGDPAMVSIKDKIDTMVQPVDTIAALRASTKIQPTVWVSGYHTEGDGAFGSNIFEWDSASTEADNVGTVIKLASVSTGRYKLRYSGAVNVKWFGAKGDGIADDTVAIQATVNNLGNIVFKNGDSYLISESIILNSNTHLDGNRATILADLNAFLCEGSGGEVGVLPIFKENITIKNFDFISTIGGHTFITTRSVNNVLIENNVCELGGLVSSSTTYKVNVWDGTPNPTATAGITSEDCLSRNIKVIGNKCTNTLLTGSCINFGYAMNCIADSNIINGYNHGIQWWGGDSNFDRGGRLVNPRWVRNLSITNNKVNLLGAGGGGIWGSMGQRVIVSNNHVEYCHDVGIDFEGGVDCVASSNTIKNCLNGNMATFFGTRNVLFTGNNSYCDIGYSVHYRNYNSTQNPTYSDSVTIDGNFCYSSSTIGTIDANSGCIKQINVTNNTLVNVMIRLDTNNLFIVGVTNNKLQFTLAHTSALEGIYVNKVHGSTQSIAINDNNIYSLVTQPLSSTAIGYRHDDFNAHGKALIARNETRGFECDIKVTQSSGNAGITLLCNVENNIMHSSNFIKENTGTGIGDVYLRGNFNDRGGNYPSDIPTTFTWLRSQTIMSNSPSAGGYAGWICTQSSSGVSLIGLMSSTAGSAVVSFTETTGILVGMSIYFKGGQGSYRVLSINGLNVTLHRAVTTTIINVNVAYYTLGTWKGFGLIQA